jgi:hypothetical protein
MLKRSKSDIALEWAMTVAHIVLIPLGIMWLWNN